LAKKQVKSKNQCEKQFPIFVNRNNLQIFFPALIFNKKWLILNLQKYFV